MEYDRTISRRERRLHAGDPQAATQAGDRVDRGHTVHHPAERPPWPEGLAPKDWVLWHCYTDVQQHIIDTGGLPETKACEATGWNYNTWRTAKRNPFVLGMWAEEIRQARLAFAAYLRESLPDIGHALEQRARDAKDPQEARDAKAVLQELRRVQEELGG
jgi:hypothetical protein